MHQPADPSQARPRASGERRRATALIARLRPPGDADESLPGAAQRILEAHGGGLQHYAGGVLTALFGVPSGHANDPIRAISAALALRDGAADPGARVALESGRILVDDAQPAPDPEVAGRAGDALLFARQLLPHAGPGEVLLGPSLQASVREYFETEPVGPLLLKGVVSEVRAHRVLRALATRRTDVWRQRGLVGFQGREVELAVMRRALEAARSGRARFVSVAGDPGVGKSRLLHELERALPAEVLVLRGDCQPFGTVTPYQPFRGLLREALGLDEAGLADADAVVARLRALGETLTEQLPVLLAMLSLRSPAHPLPAALFGDRLQEAIHEALRRLLEALAQRHPLVVLLTDWHWADVASDLALHKLWEQLEKARLLMVVDYRTHFRAPLAIAGGTTLELAPLAGPEIHRMIRELLGADLAEPLVERISRRTAGNPLFIEQICTALLESGSQGLDEIRIPTSIDAVLTERIDRLEASDAETLKLASVLGNPFRRDVLARMLPRGGPSPDDSLLALAQTGLVRLEPDYEDRVARFGHALVRDAAYGMLSSERRMQLHAAAGQALEELHAGQLQEQVEALAHHFTRSDDPDKAVHYLELSGDKAALSGAMAKSLADYREAIRILDSLRDSPGSAKQRLGIAVKLAKAAIYRPSADSLEILERTRDQAERLGDALGVMRALYWIGWVESALGDWLHAIPHLERCVVLAEARGDRKLLAQLYSNLGQAHYSGGDYPLSTDYLERAIQLRRELSGPAAIHAVIDYATSFLALIDAEAGRFEEADRRMEEVMRHRDQMQLEVEAAQLSLCSFIDAFRGDWNSCISTSEELAPRAQRVGTTYMISLTETNAGCARYFLGEKSRGLEMMRRGVATLEASEVRMSISWSYAVLAEALCLEGRYDEAETLLEHTLDRMRQSDRFGECTAMRALFLLKAGRLRNEARVDAALERAIDCARRKGAWRDVAIAHLRAAEALRGKRDPAWLSDHLEQSIRDFSAMGMAWYLERAQALRDELRAG